MSDGTRLKQATNNLIPDVFKIIDWKDIWNRDISTGTAFEWSVFAAMIHEAKGRHFSIRYPLLEEFSAPEYYVMRNEIPHSHGAQAGNSSQDSTLKERFLYSLVPKAIISKNDAVFSIFREGCPYHKIMSKTDYLDRTDIIIVPGSPVLGYPKLNPSGNQVDYMYNQLTDHFDGTLTVKNSPKIPLKKRRTSGPANVITLGIVECSVNKTDEVATEQLHRYDQLFTYGGVAPNLSLITGNRLDDMGFDYHYINLTANSDEIESQLCESANLILDNFKLL